MSDQTTTSDTISTEYDQRAAFTQFLAVGEQIAKGLVGTEPYADMTVDQVTNSIVFDFVANVLSSVVYHNDVEVIDAVMDKAKKQAVHMAKQDLALLAAPMGGAA